MPAIGDTKRAKELGFKGDALMIYELCPRCHKPRWHRKERTPSTRLCPECGRRQGALSNIDNSIEWKRASELGKIIKGDPVLYKDSCPQCGVILWHRRRDIGKRMCNDCHAIVCTKRGENHGMWDGGKHLRKDGYMEVSLTPDSPYYCMLNKGGRVLEHRLIMAQHLGRPLEVWEIVHHINSNRRDNRIDNLELLPKQADHMVYGMADIKIKKLEKEMEDMKSVIRLLFWHIQQLQHGNPELNSEQSDKCVETMGFVSPEGDNEIVRSSWKQEM